MVTDQLRQALNLLLAAGQIILPPLLFASGFNAATADVPVVADPNPATPAGYAFAVWGAIYLGAAIYAVVQVLPRHRADPLFRAIGWFTIIGYACCCAWLYAARFGPVWLTVPLIFVMLLSLGRAFVLAANSFYSEKSLKYLLTVTPLALYVGWLSAATFVNAADVLPGYGFSRFGLGAEGYGRLTVLLAAGTALAFALRTNAFPVYIGTVIWALVGIIVANGGTAFDNSIAWVSAGGVAVLLAIGLGFRGQRKRHGPLRLRPAA